MTPDQMSIEIEKIHAEIAKLSMESAKLSAETSKLTAESHRFIAEGSEPSTESLKLTREIFWYPLAIASALVGSVAAVTALAIRYLLT